nr:MAG TPA: hypothetical protein [Caudoviricetes sp.]
MVFVRTTPEKDMPRRLYAISFFFAELIHPIMKVLFS